jgi:CotH kinase protein
MKSLSVTPSTAGRRLARAVNPRLVSWLALSSTAVLLPGCQEKYYDTTYVYQTPRDDGGGLHPAPSSRPDAHVPPVDAATDSGSNPPVTDAATTTDAGKPVSVVDAQAPFDGGHTLDGGHVPEDAAPTRPPEPLEPGAPVVDSTPAGQAGFDLFENIGNRVWFVVDPAQVEAMNNGRYGGGGPQYGDIYSPGGSVSNANFADHMLVTDVESGTTADYGKVQLRVVGESTFAPWTSSTLPNIKVDSDEFVKKQRIGGYEHFRFNNAQIGSIFREKLTLDLFKKFNYPTLQANYAWVSSSVWAEDVAVPYIVVESYKRPFCKRWEDELGGGCVNMWEGVGDPILNGFGNYGGPNYDWFQTESNCQFDECDTTRAEQLVDAYAAAPQGDGFKAAMSEYIDWPNFHKFQCLEWILTIGDDMFHNSNNVVVVERADGKFQFLPWSVDISLGQSWYPVVQLASERSSIAQGCQAEEQCWADMIAVCETQLQTFIDSDPVAMLDGVHDDLEEAGMLRSGDEKRYEDLREYLAQRLVDLPIELELNREAPYNPNPRNCEYQYGYGYIDCGGVCVLRDECYLCNPEPEPEPGDGGVKPEPVVDAGPTSTPDGGVLDGGMSLNLAPAPNGYGEEDVIVIPPPPDYVPPVCEPPGYGYPGVPVPMPLK